MRKIYFLLFGCLALSGFAQAPAIQWQKCYGGSLADAGFDILQTNDGGFAILGYTNSIDGDVSMPLGLQDIWVIKTDFQGNIEWEKALGGALTDFAADIIQTTDGGYTIVGSTSPINGNGAGGDAFIIKIDADGNTQWANTFGGSNNDYFRSVRQLSDGNFYVAGSTNSMDGDLSFNNNINGNYNAWVIKLSPDGNVIWNKTYGGNGLEYIYSTVKVEDGGVVFAGNSSGPIGGDITTNNGQADVWVVKLNGDGIIQWQKSYGGTLWDTGRDIITTSDNGFIVCSSSRSADGDVSGNNGFYDIWILKLDSQGNLLWQNNYGGSAGEGNLTPQDQMRIIESANGNFTFSTSTNSSDQDITSGAGLYDFWVVQIDPVGNIIWQKTLGGEGNDTANCMVKAEDGSFVLCGMTESLAGDVSGNHSSNKDVWIVKLMPENLEIYDFYAADLQIFPNPVRATLNFQSPAFTTIDNITITDISGKIVHKCLTAEDINVENLSAGMYFVTAQYGKVFMRTKFIKQ